MKHLWVKQQLLRLLQAVLLLPAILVCFHTLVRMVRRFHKFPIPQFLANLIDNPLRRRLQPPDATAVRHGIEPGMTVLDVGPGNGRYSIAAARRIGPTGRLHVVDIEPKMIARVLARAAAEGVTNLDAHVASAYELPYPDAFFDVIYMITVTGEIPDPVRALQEFRRVLKPSGTMAVSEILVDPDYPRASTVTRWAAAAGLHPVKKIGCFFYYTLILGLNAQQSRNQEHCVASGALPKEAALAVAQARKLPSTGRSPGACPVTGHPGEPTGLGRMRHQETP